MQEFSDS